MLKKELKMKNIFKLYSLFLVLVFLISACSIQESWNDFFAFGSKRKA